MPDDKQTLSLAVEIQMVDLPHVFVLSFHFGLDATKFIQSRLLWIAIRSFHPFALLEQLVRMLLQLINQILLQLRRLRHFYIGLLLLITQTGHSFLRRLVLVVLDLFPGHLEFRLKLTFLLEQSRDDADCRFMLVEGVSELLACLVQI